MAHENWRLIRKLNSISFWGLKNIKVGDVLSTVTWDFKNWSSETLKYIDVFKVWKFDVKFSGKAPRPAFIFSHAQSNRFDQLAKFQAVTNLFEDKAVLTAKEKMKRINPFFVYIPIWYAQMKKIGYSSIIKRGICYKLCETMGYVHEMELLIKKGCCDKIVCFFDVTAADNLLVQKYSQRHFDTYTLQHGIINGSYDYIEYRCSHAKYFLAWGEYTKRMATRYGMSENKIMIVGNVNHLLEEETDLKDRCTEPVYFAVCTNGVLTKDNWKSNKTLIEMANCIAKKYKLRYFLKIHPCDDRKRYMHLIDRDLCAEIVEKGTDIIDILKKVDFTICGNSTTFCDSIYYGIPSFRYIHSSDMRKDVCKGIRFGRVESLTELEKAITDRKKDPIKYDKELAKTRDLLFAKGNIRRNYVEAIK